MNTFFQFKEFTVQQDRCAMKVCTDACLFGAWVAEKIENHEITTERILDIGSGTGLLSLMLVQKTPAVIDAVEIDKNAFFQAKENIDSSPWKNNIRLYNENILEFKAAEKYDLIICNAPFYEQQLKSPDAGRNAAMHSTALGLTELALCMKLHLSELGTAAVLLPYERRDAFTQAFLSEGLFVYEEVSVAHSSAHAFFRSILLLSASPKTKKTVEIFIKKADGEYSERFMQLLKDYYLNL